jgi:hypothetical protein
MLSLSARAIFKLVLKLCCLLVAISPTAAIAQRIENGFWYNSARGGEGYGIE